MRTLLGLVFIPIAAVLVATGQAAWADQGQTLSVSPDVVDVGLNFAGENLHIYGTVPEGTNVVVKVDGPTKSVKLNKKGKVLGLFWMTVGQAKVENMPSFHLVRSSEDMDNILSGDEQIQLGVDPMLASIMSEAEAVDAGSGTELSANEQSEFVGGLRDIYVRDGVYAPCKSCHAAAPSSLAVTTGGVGAMAPGNTLIPLKDGQWETWVQLPWDAPLGDYTVTSYCVRDGQVVGSEDTTFTVQKVGLVESLGSMAKDNAVAYGFMSLGIIIVVGMVIGFIFPRGRAGH